MASDLESLYCHYRERGLSDEEARQEAEQRILASRETLDRLIVVHTTGYQRWLSRASGGIRVGFELLLFALGVVPVLGIAGSVILPRLEVSRTDGFVWTMLFLTTAVAALSAWKFFQLFVVRERAVGALHNGLLSLLFLGMIGPVVGTLDFLFDLYRMAMRLATGKSGAGELALILERVAREATVLGMSVLLAFGAGLVWFVLANRIAAIEQAESAFLLGE